MPIISDDIFKALNIGIEKESLRVLNGEISKIPHKTELFGSPLTNQFITTDFSESQMEFVTPPFKTFSETLGFLESIHQNVSTKINDEILWPLSMPPFIDTDSNIPIAYYGESELAVFKRVYRQGLSNRYGRQMQAISGIHYNFSIDDNALIHLSKYQGNLDRNMRDNIYLGAIRNIARFNWLLLYLFGASPFVSRSILGTKKDGFEKLDHHTLFLPYATSLRMSDIGYQNSKQRDLRISLNTIEEYIGQLKTATNSISNEFSQIKEKEGFDISQLSPNVLQIEDEYYSPSRPKSSYISDDRMLKKLEHHGVSYIELRSIDLDPFEPCGIGPSKLLFLELFLIHCIKKDSPKLDEYLTKEIVENDSLVAKEGRRPGLTISRNHKQILMKDWGMEILDEMEELISESNPKKDSYIASLKELKNQLINPSLTPSAQVFNKVKESSLSYEEFGANLGKLHKNYHLNLFDNRSHNEKIIQEEVDRSKISLDKINNASEESFREYMRNYFSD